MNFLKNLCIQKKLLFGFGIIIIFSIIMAIVSISTVSYIDSKYSYLLNVPQQQLSCLKSVNESFANMRRAGFATVVFSQNMELVKDYQAQYNQYYDSTIASINKYVDINNADALREYNALRINDEDIEVLRKEVINYKTQVLDVATEYVLKGDINQAINQHMDAVTFVKRASDIVGNLISISENFTLETVEFITTHKKTSVILLLLISTSIVFLSIIIALIIASILVRPMKRLLDVSSNIVKGNLNIEQIENSRDEIGQVGYSFQKVVDVLRELLSDLDKMVDERERGNIDFYIDSKKYQGDYKKLADDIFKLISNSHDDTMRLVNIIEEFNKGNFDADIPKLPGKKALMNQKIDEIRDNMKSISGEIGQLTTQAINGNLSARANVSSYSGDWKKTIEGLNKLLATIVEPINEIVQVLGEVYKGNFNVYMKGDYGGDFNLIKTSLNTTIANISEYIKEISSVLNGLANDNLDQEVTREYVGEFTSIKDSLNNIIKKLNNVIDEINSAAEQVATGAKQLSESSMTLAGGATEQAAAVEELNTTVSEINEKTRINAENASKAKELSDQSTDNASVGNREMKRMLTAMEDIKKASNNIYKIIKTIEDIAFQTNLLALNAAVEAARAGHQGKGFSIVAEEVRNLAGKSKIAAQETTGLIENSIQKVNEGMEIADETAKTLDKIVVTFGEVLRIVTEIAIASEEQTAAVTQIDEGVSQISDVVQNNASVSEESAAATQELSEQALLLKRLTHKFKLKN